ncbi:carbonic anhydrase family protein [Helicobacter sp. MIT 21-1697]|uniref:carbonic anhydrase n=1 Tax=Helicobacter sp. MIT 21-1697 TaxID=2993733 RepID=UPI00224B7475|nr:carbonic anhydrase family protein [Helicobacter sp. MIT 21-1697]MCX2716878.1 carbonic anhydrase family protein [Helicobacter sp. MIT 21-1697]
MKKQFVLLLITSVLQAAHWGYDIDDGPDKWASLSPNYTLCKNGKHQSPINITRSRTMNTDNYLTLAYKTEKGVAKNITNNGHSVQINFQNGGEVSFKNIHYSLVQLHFHTPSEMQIEGKIFPMEMHIVHQNKKGDTLVIAALFEEGKENPSLQKIIDSMPTKTNQSKSFSTLDMNGILPEQSGYYAFDGSLTTPPCSENVQWVVFQNPTQASKRQIMAFQAILHHNARDVQPLDNRVIEIAPPQLK